MKKKKNRNQKSLTLIIIFLCGAGLISGCNNNIDLFHEIFRSDKQKNMEQRVTPFEIDYQEHDEENDYTIINDRAYLPTEAKPMEIQEETVDVPLPMRYRIPSINATYIQDANDRIILQYRSRLPAEDLAAIIEKVADQYLNNIQVNNYQNQNMLVFTGNKKDFGDFTTLVNLLTEFDLPAVQVRTRLSIIEYFNDNTYDREFVLEMLEDEMRIFYLNLPSLSDPSGSELSTGIEINPLYNNTEKNKYTLESALRFLDSYGKARVFSDIDILASNGEKVTFKNVSSVPYPELLEGKTGFLETIKYRDTGTTIELTPFANDKGFITIKIPKAETGEQTGWSGPDQRPTFRTADLGTGFVVRDGIPYFAATSLFTRYKEVRRGIPLLNKIPILKEIFSSKSIENNQSQLLYFVEARIIERDSDVGTRITEVPENYPEVLTDIEQLEGSM